MSTLFGASLLEPIGLNRFLSKHEFSSEDDGEPQIYVRSPFQVIYHQHRWHEKKEEKRAMSNKEKERGQLEMPWEAPEEISSLVPYMKEFENVFGEATRLMVEAAALVKGSYVLDVAAGAGGQSLVAARKVGPMGAVLATDISPEMLTVAAQWAEQEGLTTITTQVRRTDLENLVVAAGFRSFPYLSDTTAPRSSQTTARFS